MSPDEYFWGYNRMTTVEGLFGAGDAVGGTPHAFSSGSFTEGRLAAKAACKYIDDGKAEGIKCARSWKYFDPATADPDFPDVTPRDAAAIREVRG